MDEAEILQRLTKVEERSKSNTHRLDKLEPIIEEIHVMSEALVRLTTEVQHTNENISEMKGEVEELKNKPSVRMEQIKTSIITAVISSLIGGMIAAILF